MYVILEERGGRGKTEDRRIGIVNRINAAVSTAPLVFGNNPFRGS